MLRLRALRQEADWAGYDALLQRLCSRAPARLRPYVLGESLYGMLYRGRLAECLTRADSLRAEFPDHAWLRGVSWNLSGIVELYRGNYESATERLYAARDVFADSDDRLHLAYVLHNLGMVHGATEGYAEAEAAFRSSLAALRELRVAGLRGILFNLGNLYSMRDQPDSTRHYYRLCLGEAQDERKRGQVLNGLAASFLDDPQLDSACHYLHRALLCRLRTGDRRGEAYTRLTQSRYFRLRALPDSARGAADRALALADSLGLASLRQNVISELAEIEALADNSARAVELSRHGQRLKDSLVGADKIRGVLAIVASRENPGGQPLGILLLGGSLLFALLGGLWLLSRRRNAEAPVVTPEELDQERAEAAQLRRELVATRLELSSDGKFYDDIVAYLDTLGDGRDDRALFRLRNDIGQHQQFRTDWVQTMHHFRQVYPDFFRKLKQQHPRLTSGDIRHIGFLRMGLAAKEVAAILHVKHTTVEMARYRLKKKLGLGREDDLFTYLMNV